MSDIAGGGVPGEPDAEILKLWSVANREANARFAVAEKVIDAARNVGRMSTPATWDELEAAFAEYESLAAATPGEGERE